jgi:hypothetical protein
MSKGQRYWYHLPATTHKSPTTHCRRHMACRERRKNLTGGGRQTPTHNLNGLAGCSGFRGVSGPILSLLEASGTPRPPLRNQEETREKKLGAPLRNQEVTREEKLVLSLKMSMELGSSLRRARDRIVRIIGRGDRQNSKLEELPLAPIYLHPVTFALRTGKCFEEEAEHSTY